MGFLLIAMILLTERIGIVYKAQDTSKQILPREEVQNLKVIPKEHDTLIVYDPENAASTKAMTQYDSIMTDMRVGYDKVEISRVTNAVISKYKKLIIIFPNLNDWSTQIETVKEWTDKGGHLMLGYRPQYSGVLASLSDELGIKEFNDDYILVNSFISEPDFMLGSKSTYHIIDGYESSIDPVLSGESHVYAKTEAGLPLIWKHKTEKGMTVVCNFAYCDKAYRGIFAAAFSLLDDVTVYPVINASTYYLDDFPSPIQMGDATYIKRDYNMDVAEFYSSIWWPDVLKLSDKHNIQYTGLIIETYSDKTKGRLAKNEVTSDYDYFGNLLLGKGGEIGWHGYNHQPLCTNTFTYKENKGYNRWPDKKEMKKSLKELDKFTTELFPEEKAQVYVPPSNILSDEGRDVLTKNFKNIKAIASIYFTGKDEYSQEFSVSPDGIVETPRIVSSCVLDDYMRISAFSELNMHYVNSHFMHPDDLLDVDRGAEIGWKKLSANLDDYMTWVDESAPDIEHVTGSGMAGAVQRFVNVIPETKIVNGCVEIDIAGLLDKANFFVRINEGEVGKVSGGNLTKLNDTLYLLKADKEKVSIELK